MKKISVKIEKHQTSISLEDEFVDELKKLAKKREVSINALVAEIEKTFRPDLHNLSSKIRIFILENGKK